MRALLVFLVVVVALAAGTVGLWMALKTTGAGREPLATRLPRASAGLARAYAPILLFDTNEKFFPVARRGYVARTRLRVVRVRREVDVAPDVDVVNEDPEVSDLVAPKPECPPRYDGCHYSLKFEETTGAPRTLGKYVGMQMKLEAAGAPTVYWHATSRRGRVVAIQYWIFYVFNNFLNWHEGDWEQITVDVRNRKRPRFAYSSHNRGQRAEWDELAPGVGRIGRHPVVYVANGSHANYFRAGFHRADDCPNWLRREIGNRCDDRSNGRGAALVPTEYSLVPLTPPVFASGDWGAGNYFRRGAKCIRVGRFGMCLGYGLTVPDPQVRKSWREPLEWLEGARPAELPGRGAISRGSRRSAG